LRTILLYLLPCTLLLLFLCIIANISRINKKTERLDIYDLPVHEF
jgi:hypothetical protein